MGDVPYIEFGLIPAASTAMSFCYLAAHHKRRDLAATVRYWE